MKPLLIAVMMFLLIPAFSGTGFSAVEVLKDLYEQASDAYNAGEHDRAISHYQQIIQIAPRFAPAYNGLGLVHRAKGTDPDEVMYYFRTAIEMDPNFIQSYDNLGKIQYTIGLLKEAEETFHQALAVDPDFTSAYFSLGWIYLLGYQDARQAVAAFEKVAQDSELPMAWFGMGLGYLMQKDRLRTMEIITKLRAIEQPDMAGQLEDMLRENKYRLDIPGLPDIGPRNRFQSTTASVLKDPQHSPPPAPQAASVPQTEYNFPVRLRAPLPP